MLLNNQEFSRALIAVCMAIKRAYYLDEMRAKLLMLPAVIELLEEHANGGRDVAK
jgi:hypothetical protein